LGDALIDQLSLADVDESISGALIATAGGADVATAYVVDVPPPHPATKTAATNTVSSRVKHAARSFLIDVRRVRSPAALFSVILFL